MADVPLSDDEDDDDDDDSEEEENSAVRKLTFILLHLQKKTDMEKKTDM